jgi:mannosidase alpha-like ER degradation enhancer 2
MRLLAPLLLLLSLPAFAQISPTPPADLAAAVRQEYRRCWESYRARAWGHDELKPVSGGFSDWSPGQPLQMTMIDALDGLLMMRLDTQANEAIDYIVKNTRWDVDAAPSAFETNIRLVGGLIASYQMTGRRELLDLAEDLARRLLPAFDSPTGMPYRFVNLKTGRVSGPDSNPAEIGTYIVEFGMLSRLTGRPVYFEKAKKALQVLYGRRSALGLVGEVINVETGEWKNTNSHVSARIDSYYEYVLKGAMLFDDADLMAMWKTHHAALNRHVAWETPHGLIYGWVNMHDGGRLAPYFGGLDAFLPAVLALAGDLDHARPLMQSCHTMWTLHGLEPEQIDFFTMNVTPGNEGYPLRPEIIESAYYLFHFTGDPQYQRMGERYFRDLQRYCRTPLGFTEITDVRTKTQGDRLHSFLFAETLKYCYLLFTARAPGAFDFNSFIFTTEAHPMRKKG